MNEINRLRQRLRNVGRNVLEYKMTIAEARALIAEFDARDKVLQEKPQQVVINEPVKITRIIDGGHL
jgi:hypothetical protein